VGIGARVHPVALLQADDTDTGAREPPGDGGPRGAGADHQHVGAIGDGHSRTGNIRRGPPPSTLVVILLAEDLFRESLTTRAAGPLNQPEPRSLSPRDEREG